MPNVNVIAIGEARKMVGFSQQKVEIKGTTVADLLREVATLDGQNLYANLVCEGELRSDYAVLINGTSVCPSRLETPIQEGDQVVTMAILRHLHGG